jgi:hypothetical protein
MTQRVKIKLLFIFTHSLLYKMANIAHYMETSEYGGGGINIKALFGEQNIMRGGGGNSSNDDDDLYIPYGLYCRTHNSCIYPKQTYSKQWLDELLFDNLFEAVNGGGGQSSQKTRRAPAKSANKTKRRS